MAFLQVHDYIIINFLTSGCITEANKYNFTFILTDEYLTAFL